MPTQHYQKRAKQRGIREPLIQLIYDYGQRYSRPGGAEAIKLGGIAALLLTENFSLMS